MFELIVNKLQIFLNLIDIEGPFDCLRSFYLRIEVVKPFDIVIVYVEIFLKVNGMLVIDS